jgi:dTDP-glucose 4,6-dehydratase
MYDILITGANGFVGKSLTDYLLKETECNIVSMQRSNPIMPKVHPKRVKIIYQDLRTSVSHDNISEIGDIKYIVHLAGANGFENKDTSRYIEDNVSGTLNLLEYSKNLTNLEKVLYLSTAEVFGPPKPGFIFNEEDEKNPSSTYASTKLLAEDLCDLYNEIHDIPVLTAYAMNTFGPIQSRKKYIPLLIDKVSKGEEVDIYLDQTGEIPNRRNYLYIEDFCNAIWFLLNHGSAGEKYNIASRRETDNLELAESVSKLLNKNLIYKLVERKLCSPLLPQLSGEKLFKMGWQQKFSLEEGLKMMINNVTENN